eukprot:4848878-Prymnesium_polylepis.1
MGAPCNQGGGAHSRFRKPLSFTPERCSEADNERSPGTHIQCTGLPSQSGRAAWVCVPSGLGNAR